MKILYMLLSLLLVSGCSLFVPKAEVPMSVERAQDAKQSDTLLVMLPGRRGRVGDYREKGFFDMARAEGLDVVSAYAHLGYYLNETVTERLHEDVVKPARAQGYQRIWLAGISMGGLGALLYDDDYPGSVEGLILLAPYTGDEEISEDIRAAGGLMAWDGHSDAGEEFQRRAWRRLQARIRNNNPPAVVLGFGRDDRFAPANKVIAEALPEPQTFTIPGGHTWTTWKPLWQQILDAGFPGHVEVAQVEKGAGSGEQGAVHSKD